MAPIKFFMYTYTSSRFHDLATPLSTFSTFFVHTHVSIHWKKTLNFSLDVWTAGGGWSEDWL